MDLSRTGKFIQERRKAKKLTQVQLAQKISVSEKTISKWECGKGFPDTTLMLPLCSALEISANELLSGKLLKNEEYKPSAEENLINLTKQATYKDRLLLSLEWIIIITTILFFTSICIIAAYIEMSTAIKVLLLVFGMISLAINFSFTMVIEKNAGYYVCKYCHHKYIPTYNQIIWSMHMCRTRYMKCPKCSKRSWQKKSVNKD